MSLIQQWANNIGIFEPVNGSWIQAIGQLYNGSEYLSDNWLRSIALSFNLDDKSNLYYAIAVAYSRDEEIQPLNGSWLARVVELTTK